MRALQRIGGISAIAGGVLRVVNTFTAGVLPQGTLAVLYVVTDVFLLAGVAGLWLQRRATLGAAGVLGLVVFVAGILTIRASAFGVGSYPLGAAVALLGLALYSLETVITRAARVGAPVAWLIALMVGAAGAMGFAPVAMTALAGVLFGAGFAIAGWRMFRD